MNHPELCGGYCQPRLEELLCEVERGFVLSQDQDSMPPSFSEDEGTVKDESDNWGY